MDIKQIATFVNQATEQATGQTNLVKEDLSNVVDLGKTLETFQNGVDGFAKALPNVIGKFIFDNRVYKGDVPSVLMDGWTYGSIVEKIRGVMPSADENESWELNDGEVYEQDQFYKTTISVKLYNLMTTFEIPISITDRVLRQSFQTPQQLAALVAMIYNNIDKAITSKLNELIHRAINNFIGETVYSEFPAGDYSGSGVKAVNVLKLYNDTLASPLTVSQALVDKDFWRFVVVTFKNYIERMKSLTKLYNIGKTDKFTPPELLHVVLHSQAVASIDGYLQSDTFHNELTKLPTYETVSYWQGVGQNFEFAQTSKIDVTTAGGHSVSLSGIIGVMFDRDALGVWQMDRRVTSHYNAKAEFTNNYHKVDVRYFNDLDEQFVVFYMA